MRQWQPNWQDWKSWSQKKTSKEIQNIIEKFDKFISQLSKSFEAIKEMQNKVMKLQDPKIYAAATGHQPDLCSGQRYGKTYPYIWNENLGIHIKGVPEPQGTASNQILQERQAVQ